MDAKAARDRDALKAELGQKKKGGRRDLSEEAREHADKMVQEVRALCRSVATYMRSENANVEMPSCHQNI